jgi:hypothetical protein
MPLSELFPFLTPLPINSMITKLTPQLPLFTMIQKRSTFTPFIPLYDYILSLIPCVVLTHLGLH